ncbi:TRAP transporter small permease subunit [Thiolapillus brandeum]|uniref:TRAP transporter small permease protein n=1 Tax=Thiolapillus brandeum TaxID=1076588 RepID=A0A7U6GGZ0_9GAMM|nr:TRAP transporter small permease subunit [Thiolapillus brandeum]BAO43452.1 TRAP transporter DctQ subunit [Thiolapillus brandeum]
MIRKLEAIAELSGRVIAWATLLMVLVTFCVVVLRYAFNTGWIAMQESITYLHATVFMLGAAYTFKDDGHVRVDIFYQKFGNRGRAWVNLMGTILLLYPLMIFILWVSWEYVTESWKVMEGSREAGGLPGVFLLKSLLLLMPVAMMMQGLVTILRSLDILTGSRHG